ncbi:MAG: hypothetical protein AB7S98_15210, partial [Burkholderiaceae bacterium]
MLSLASHAPVLTAWLLIALALMTAVVMLQNNHDVDMDITVPIRTAAVVGGSLSAEEALSEFAAPGHGRRLRAGQLTDAEHWLFIRLPV